jgi:hypothetical protein
MEAFNIQGSYVAKLIEPNISYLDLSTISISPKILFIIDDFPDPALI